MEENKSPVKEADSQKRLQQKLGEMQDAGEKIRLIIDFMREALSQKGQPRFRDFWEAKKICLGVFKELENPLLRSNLWNEYIELTSEAKRLKEILDQQSSFSIEQIELAIEVLKQDMESEKEKIQELPRIEFPKEAHTLRDREKIYNQKQLEIHFLHTMTQRVRSLRSETIQTEMRIRHKNRILQKLSKFGDIVFPRRKQLVQEVSENFLEDVQLFASNHFSDLANPGLHEGGKSIPLYVLKEEIKAFQRMAKVLSLSPDCFTRSRKILSECFESVKKKEKERKQEYTEKKEQFKHNFEAMFQEIKEFEQWVQAKEFTKEELENQVSFIMGKMKDTELVRDQVRALKDELQRQRRIAEAKIHEKQQGEKQKTLEEKNKRIKEVEMLFESYKKAAKNTKKQSAEELAQIERELKDQASGMSFSLEEESRLIFCQEDLYQHYLSKKEEEVMQDESSAQFSRKLEDLLDEKIDFRERIKNRLEEFRRLSGSSGLDFERAMLYREWIEKERSRFEELNDSIESLEERLIELQGE